ncbi:hypothetical protein P3X46_002917 [Hevea brasiliensis]|uniref:Uncharacterized protein n=1 Tax=Hevea brasiliensis TaxID=3981 RepID=A0ABQ9N4K8_HEVBR|nr:photosynthetic NDH subunit of lumenal location 2, chloroplastic [Hevea brasiliensis]KAJ9187462.1 hypothetical protein P3X46_002917 [Hevea brasiliensis]
MITSSLTNTPALLRAHSASKLHNHSVLPVINASISSRENVTSNRRRIVITTTLATSVAPPALAENWGVRSFLWERFFEPDLSPEDSVARIRQTAEGLHSIRDMLETMSWRYVMFYIRLKQAYLSKDLKIAMATLPKGRWKQYVELANDLVENMARFDQYVRSPKVYESYLYYEKTLKSIDDVVAYLA